MNKTITRKEPIELLENALAIKLLFSNEFKSAPRTPYKNGDNLQILPVGVDADYRKKWNEDLTDFVGLFKDGKRINDTLYRVGGLNYPDLTKDRYFMLIKHVEEFYSKDILKMSGSKDPRHLAGHWCIIDAEGNEKVVFDGFKHAYLTKDSCIYSMGRNYYNIETGELYCNASNAVESKDFLFLQNDYDKDKSRVGVMKINKKTGTFELFPI